MRISLRVIFAVCLLSATALAQEKPNPDQIKKAYEDALVQLKAAQDSKNALAKDNEKLTKQIEELKKQLAGSQDQIQTLKREVSDNDQKTFYLRSYQAAWRHFIEAHPDLSARWKLFLKDDVLAIPHESNSPIRLDWSLPAPGDDSDSK